MKKPLYIRHSKKFFGYFEVVNGNHVIPCYNFATARSIKQKLAAEHEKKTGLQQDN